MMTFLLAMRSARLNGVGGHFAASTSTEGNLEPAAIAMPRNWCSGRAAATRATRASISVSKLDGWRTISGGGGGGATSGAGPKASCGTKSSCVESLMGGPALALFIRAGEHRQPPVGRLLPMENALVPEAGTSAKEKPMKMADRECSDTHPSAGDRALLTAFLRATTRGRSRPLRRRATDDRPRRLPSSVCVWPRTPRASPADAHAVARSPAAPTLPRSQARPSTRRTASRRGGRRRSMASR